MDRHLDLFTVMQSVCSESGSFDLAAPSLGSCIAEAQIAYTVAVKRQETIGGGGGDQQVGRLY